MDSSICRPVSASRYAFSLIEAAIVLGIIGLVIGGIWMAAANANERLRQSTAKKDVLTIVHNIRGLYQQESEDGNIDAIAIAAKAVPNNWVNGSNLSDPWGKPVNLMYTVAPGTACTSFEPVIVVDFLELNLKSCIILAEWAKTIYPKDLTAVFIGYFDGDGVCSQPPESDECATYFDGTSVRMQLIFSAR